MRPTIQLARSARTRQTASSLKRELSRRQAEKATWAVYRLLIEASSMLLTTTCCSGCAGSVVGRATLRAISGRASGAATASASRSIEPLARLPGCDDGAAYTVYATRPPVIMEAARYQMKRPLHSQIDATSAQPGSLNNYQSKIDPVPIVKLRSVGKTFQDGTVALCDVSLVVGRGEFVSIVGPSGCGKSTLLRIVSSLTSATTGTVECPATRNIGYVFQDPTLLPWRTVAGNVKLLCELRGLSRTERNRRAAEVLRLVGLDGFERHRPRQLSGGMRMRLSLARALTIEPTLFLFDEPFGALDEITRQRLNMELLRLFAQKKFAAVFVTHSVSEAVHLSNRVLVMSTRPGRIIAEFRVPGDLSKRGESRFDTPYVEVAAAVSRALRGASE